MREFRPGRDRGDGSQRESDNDNPRDDSDEEHDRPRTETGESADRLSLARRDWRMRAEIARSAQQAREARIAEAAERGVRREQFEANEAAAAEDGRCAHELEITRYEVRQGPPEYDGTRKVSDAEKQAFWDERNAKQEKALERFRTEPVEGPDNRPLDPERQRDFVAGHWRRGDPPYPAGDISRRDELTYTRREPRDRSRADEPTDAQARPELAGTTVPVREASRERFPDGVRYDDAGHPDLSRYASKTVHLDNGHDTPNADDRANELFGWGSTPDGKAWHKTSDGHTVLLVDADLHRQFGPSDHYDSEPQDQPAQPREDSTADNRAVPNGGPGLRISEAATDAPSEPGVPVVRGDGALAGLAFDPSNRREALGECFRPGVYDAHNSLDQMAPADADQVLHTAKRAADLGARIDIHHQSLDFTIRWDGHDTGTIADLDALAAFLARGKPADIGGSEGAAPRGGIDASSGASYPDAERWEDPARRKQWVEDWVGESAHVKAVTSGAPWADFQRANAGDYEVALETDEPDVGIWADGLAVDPDRVVAVEVKYVARPARSLYEGNAPQHILERAMGGFDKEMERYARVIRYAANPVERMRIVTNTAAAAAFLGDRARKVLGDDIDLDVQVRPEED
ncbi:restriction endonuclease fold toxin-2 domain-containing protein [Kribbella sp. NPDC059898]|uniref:restriction endonuclease fold toxin-2 domain-containing protein n=1 Tax=Kribbella sp. NPDC059898 TaxID=3346995 RepID=UPI0036515918